MGLDTKHLVAEPVARDPEALASGFRRAMRRLAATVSIVATREDGVNVGMAATSVSSLSAAPPSLLFSLAHTASLCQPLLRQGRFSVNILTLDHAPLVGLFSGQIKGPERFHHGAWEIVDDLPVLADAQAALLCRIAAHHGFEGQEIVVGQIEAIRVREQIFPLLWQDAQVAETHPLGSTRAA